MDQSTLRVLLIDDNPQYVDVIRHFLRPFQGKQFEISWVNEGEKALELLRSKPPLDLILMDYFLPGTTGVDLAKTLFEEKTEIPIILLTSNRDFRVAIEAMKYGVGDYLIKEEAVDTVLPRTIINAVERHRLNAKIHSVEKQKVMAEKTAETIQELIVTMCHEFNNPLAAIKISADIILRQKISDHQRDLLTRLNVDIGLIEQQIVKLRDMNADTHLNLEEKAP
jgi:DNA-binding NtrC family response regulator